MGVVGRVEAGPPKQEGEWEGGGQAGAVGEQEGQEDGRVEKGVVPDVQG